MYGGSQRRSTKRNHTRSKDSLSLGGPHTHLGVFARQERDSRFLERETGTRGTLVSLRIVQGITFGIVMTSCQ